MKMNKTTGLLLIGGLLFMAACSSDNESEIPVETGNKTYALSLGVTSSNATSSHWRTIISGIVFSV